MYYYDGTLHCFTGGHLPYGMIAIIIIVFLILFPLYVLAMTLNLINVRVSDTFIAYVPTKIVNFTFIVEARSNPRCDKLWN